MRKLTSPGPLVASLFVALLGFAASATAQPTVNLTIHMVGAGGLSGIVGINPTGGLCSVSNQNGVSDGLGNLTSQCTFPITTGTTITVVANAPGPTGVPGVFSSPTGSAAGCGVFSTCAFTINSASDLTVTFDSSTPAAAMNTTLAGDGPGSVFVGDTRCQNVDLPEGSECTTRFAQGSLITLQAGAPAAGRFSGFSFGTNNATSCGTAGSCSFVLSADTSITASFSALLSVAVNPPSASINVGSTLQFTASGTYVDGQTVQIFPGNIGTWTTKASMSHARFDLQAAVAGGQLYAIGGNSSAPNAWVESYNPATDTWLDRASMQIPRAGFATGTISDRFIYAAGGSTTGGGPVDSAEVYDAQANQWVSLPSMPGGARRFLAGGVVNGVLYAVGGEAWSDANDPATAQTTNRVEAFDPTLNGGSWVSKASMPTARRFLTVAVANGILYAIGGDNAGNNANGENAKVEAYDPAHDTWTTLAPLPNGGRTVLAAAAIDGALYVAGGQSGFLSGSLFAYDPIANTWSTKASIPSIQDPVVPGQFDFGARGELATATIGGRLYAVGGYADPNGVPNPVALSTLLSFVDNLVWSTSDPSVATVGQVPSGIANGAGAGTTNVIVRSGTTLCSVGSGACGQLTVTVAVPLNPPTLGVSANSVLAGSSVTASGTGLAGANVQVFDGASPVGGLIPVAGGSWSTSLNFIVGSHTLTATQTNGSQTSAASAPVTVHVRPQPPTIQNPGTVISATTTTVSLSGSGFYGAGQPTPTGSTVTIFENGVALTTTPPGTIQVQSNGQWFATIAFAVGSHTLTASQALAGETSDLSGSTTFSVSAPLAAPVMTVPVNNATVTAGSGLTVSGTGQSGASVNVFAGASQVAFGVPVTGGTWSTSVNLMAGTQSLTATQSSGGQTSPASASVTVHVQPSTPSINNPNTVFAASVPVTATVYGTGYFVNGVNPIGATVTIFESGSSIGTSVVGSNGQWSASVSFASTGQHFLTASQAVGGETSATSSQFTLNVNISNVAAPTLFASPTDNVAPGDSVAISGTGVANASLTVFDGSQQLQSGIPIDGTGHWSISRAFNVGTHPLTASQSSNGQTSPLSATVTVHVLPPAPSIVGPSSVNAGSSPSFFTLYGSGFYNAGQSPSGATVTIFDGGNAIGSTSVFPGGTWSAGIQLAFGQHNLTVSQALSGETSALSSPAFIVTVSSTTLNSPFITTPSNNFAAVAGANVTVGGNAQSGATVSLFDGPTLLQGGIPVNSGTWSVMRQFAIGAHPLTASQTNTGQTSSLSPTITVNVTPPAPVITSAVPSSNSVTVSGTGTSGAVVTFLDGSNNIGGGATVIDDGTGHGTGTWSTVLNFSVGSHSLSARQSVGVLTSVASSSVAVNVAPSAPSISGPNSATGSTSPVTFTLTGSGFFSNNTGAAVAIFEGGSQIAGTSVGSNNQWSASLTLAYGSHSLTATQTFATLTSVSSSAFVVNVGAPLVAPTLQVSPTIVVAGTNFTAHGIGFAGAQVSIFDGANVNPVASGVLVAADTTWSTPVGLTVGAHTLTAKESKGGVLSGPSGSVVVQVRPPAPNVSNPSSVTTAIVPVSVTLHGSGFFGGAQNLGSTVTISEGATTLGTALVQTDNSWSATISLASYGQHTLTTREALAGETSDPSTFILEVDPTLVSFVISPSTAAVVAPNGTFLFNGIATFSDQSTMSTNGQVRNGATWSVAPASVASITNFGQATGLAPGSATVTLTVQDAGTAQATLTVYQPTLLLLNQAQGVAGAPITLIASLSTFPGGAPLAGQTVQFDFGGAVPSAASTTDANGVASASVVFPNAGAFNATASFFNPAGSFVDENGNPTPDTSTALVNVTPAATSLSKLNVPSTSLVGNSLTASTTLSRVSAPAGVLANEPVVFTLTPQGGPATVTTVTTDANGLAIASFPLTATGPYTVAAAFAATAGLQPSSTQASTSVFQRTSLLLNPANGVAGSVLTLSASLQAVPGNTPLAGQTVNFDFGGVVPSLTGITNATGVATVSATFSIAGTFAATASFSNLAGYFADSNGNIVADTASASVNVAAATTSLSPLSVPTTSFAGGQIVVSTVLRRVSAPSGAAASAQVVFTLTAPGGAVTTETALTDVSGFAAVTFQATTSGQSTIAASFAGDAALLASSTAPAPTAVYQRTVLSLNQANGSAGTALTVSAGLHAFPGNGPVAGQTVTFDFAGVIPAASATTDANGNASVSVVFPTPGAFPATASFVNIAGFFADANGNLAAATASATVTVSSVFTSLSALNVPSFGLVGNSLAVSTTLSRVTAPAGALANRPVVFTLTPQAGPATQLTGTTDVNGNASVSFPLAASGPYTVAATFAGDSGLQSSAAAPVSTTVYQRTLLTLGSATGTPGSPITLSATLASAPGNTPLAGQFVTFDFAGVIPPQTAVTNAIGAASVSVTFPVGGSFNAVASFFNSGAYFTNQAGAVPSAPTTTATSVTVANIPPVVVTSGNIAVPSTGASGATATFSVSATSYGNPITVSCLPFSSGDLFPVGVTTETCTAADTFGGVGTANFTVTVGPYVSLSGITISEGAPGLTTGAGVTDPNASATVTVDYGDGSGIHPLTAPFLLSHIYADNGSYTVTVAITDAQLGHASASAVVTVNNVAPAVTISTPTHLTVNEGQGISGAGSFADPGTDTWTATIDYGDGSGAQPLALGGPDGLGAAGTFSFSHVYATSGAYNIVVTVTDDDTGYGTATLLVTDNNVAPSVSISPNSTTINEGQSLTGSASFADPGKDGPWTATVSYGDGSASQTVSLAAPGAFALNHAYAASGVYTVTVTVTDDKNSSGSATVQVTVASPVGRFVALSRDMTWLRANSTVVTGDVGATDRRHADHTGDQNADDGDRDDVTMRVGTGATMQQSSSRVVGDTVLLLNKSSIFNVVDNFLLQNKNATVGGTKTSTMNVPYTSFPAFVTGTPGTAAVTVAKNKTSTLAPGNYGTVHVSNGATLILSGGTYNMVSLDVDAQGTVIFHAATEIRIKTELDSAAKSKFILDAAVVGLKASQIKIYVEGADSVCQHSEADDDGDDAGQTSVHIGTQSVVQANIYALNGTVWLKSKTQATGAFLGVHVRIGVNATITLDSAFK